MKRRLFKGNPKDAWTESGASGTGQWTDPLVFPGQDGQPGPRGADGPQGAQGPPGPAGSAGPQGIQGPSGATGATGATGPAGSKGDTGDQGPQGVPGTSGTQGPQGTPGPPGVADPLAIWRVGCIYTSVDPTDPATMFGGTWLSIGGFVLAGYLQGDPNFGTPGQQQTGTRAITPTG